jgi:hypothetical protein
MKLSEFQIDLEFYMGDSRWRVTDVGSRAVCAIHVDEAVIANGTTKTTYNKRQAEENGWFNGPPYGVAETVIDEYDQDACTLAYAYILGIDNE